VGFFPVRAVIFDFDYTLADSSAGAVECVNYALRLTGLPEAEPSRIHQTIGLSTGSALERLAGVTDPAVVAAYFGHFLERADQVMADLTRVYPCVPTVLDELRARGLRLGIVSTKLRYRIETILERAGLADRFSVVVGGEDTALPKPAPDGLFLAARQLDSAPPASVYVGDHPVDAQAAAGAGIPFVATLTGVSGREVFADFEPLAVIADLSGLPGVLAPFR
jgi:phosphoglycolate phosphatase